MEALPVYIEAQEHGSAPGYYEDYLPADEEPTLESSLEKTSTPEVQRSASTIADGKTAQQIIQEAKDKAAAEKPTKKERFKKMLSEGVNMTMGA